MKLIKNERYNPNYDPKTAQPLTIFKYAMEFDTNNIIKICGKYKNPHIEIPKWCDENIGPMMPTDDDRGWHWALLATPLKSGIEAIIYFHTIEDAMAFKLRWL